MEDPLLIDKSQEPGDADLEQLLGRARRHWDKLIQQATTADPAARSEWKFYSKKSGWVLVVRGKKSNVLYMRPIAKRRFYVSFTYADRHVEAVAQSALPPDVIKQIQNAKKYPEGRAAGVDVTTAAEYRIARTLLEIKQGV